MAVTSYREVVPRTFQHKFGSTPTATLQYVATVDGPTGHGEVLAAIGIQHNSTHPEYSNLECDDISIDETDRHHVTVTYAYIQRPGEGTEGGIVGGADKWAFSTSNTSVAATEYYEIVNIEAAGRKPLANRANDAYEGLSRAEPEIRATITGTRWTFPLGIAGQVAGTINSAPFAGFAKHTWQCVGISGTPDLTVVGDPASPEVKDYWNITVELVYRRGTHNLFLPHVGLNYLEGGVQNKKKRCWIVDSETGERVASPGALPLDANGDLKQIGAGPYPPEVWEYRIYPELDFTQFFGSPPESVG